MRNTDESALAHPRHTLPRGPGLLPKGYAMNAQLQAIVNQHLNSNRVRIEAEARQYAKNYGCSYEVALRDVRDEYVGGVVAEFETRE